MPLANVVFPIVMGTKVVIPVPPCYSVEITMVGADTFEVSVNGNKVGGVFKKTAIISLVEYLEARDHTIPLGILSYKCGPVSKPGSLTKTVCKWVET